MCVYDCIPFIFSIFPFLSISLSLFLFLCLSLSLSLSFSISLCIYIFIYKERGIMWQFCVFANQRRDWISWHLRLYTGAPGSLSSPLRATEILGKTMFGVASAQFPTKSSHFTTTVPWNAIYSNVSSESCGCNDPKLPHFTCVYIYIHIGTLLNIYLAIYLAIYLCIHVSIHPSIYLFWPTDWSYGTHTNTYIYIHIYMATPSFKCGIFS